MTQIQQYFIAVILLGLLVCAAQAEPLRVTLLVAEEGVAYREFAQSFAGEAARQNLALSISQANTLPPKSELIVAVGIKSAAMAVNSHAFVLCVLVSKASFEKLLHERTGHQEKNSFSAIYLDQPSKRQIDLVAAALPEVKNIGLLFATHPADIAGLRKAVTERGFTLHEQQLGSEESLHRDLQLLLQKSGVLLAIPDAQVYNASTIRNILLETYRSGNPVVGFSPSYVRAGALCAVFSTQEQITRQALHLTRQFAETGRLSAAQYPVEFEVMVNRQVARALGIQVGESTALSRQMKTAATAGGGNK